MLTPTEIYALLQGEVIGQDQALHEMAVAIYKHLISHSVGNVLMIGNSGTGKTTIMRAVENFFATNAGFEKYSTIIRINANLVADLAIKGAQTNVVMDRLAREAARVLSTRATIETMSEYVAHGIVCVDEVDKIRAVVGGEPNVKGIVAQDSLLTLMENENVQVALPYYEDGGWHEAVVPVNTRHILFVAGGAFEELYNQVLHRVTEKHGLSSLYRLVPRADGTLDKQMVFLLGDHLAHDDLFRYGMSPQFLARFQSIIMLGDLSAPTLLRIFREVPHSIWHAAVDYFKHANIELRMTDDVAMLIADRAALNNRMGARALAEIFGKVIRRFEFDPDATGLMRDEKGRKVLELTVAIIKETFKQVPA
jgi:ATP-dependent Clp protease ATP-binding subunit ClpX